MKQFAWMVLTAPAVLAQNPSVDDIMARVAANQAKSVEARRQFVYRQDELVTMRRSNGKLECSQRRQYAVTPGPNDIERQLVNPPERGGDVGRCQVSLTDDSGQSLSMSTGSQGDSFTMSLGKTKDGVPRGLFPLTAQEQRLYQYKLLGTETYRGRKVYRISFRPNKQKDSEGAQGYWKGIALVEAAEFEPVEVSTDLAKAIPLAVRVLLGTNIHGLGFTVSYQQVADGVWFPAGYGGEFSVRALFFFKAVATVNVRNSEFRRTDVNSSVTFSGK